MSPKEKFRRKTEVFGEDSSPKLSYKLDQICVDVKIVDIQPDNERCIGFVYAKRDGNGGLIKERGVKALEPVWGEEISYMTLSDFEGFIESRKKCYTL